MKAHFLLNEPSLSLHSHTSAWLWLTGVLALGFVLGICVFALGGDRQNDDGDKKQKNKKAIFVFCT